MTDDPASLAAAATGGDVPADAIGDSAGDAIDPSDAADGQATPSILDMLLSTEPDESPDDYPDLSDPTSHAVIGVKKMANEALDIDLGTGTPAIENFARAGVGWWVMLSDPDSEDDDGDPDEDELGYDVPYSDHEKDAADLARTEGEA